MDFGIVIYMLQHLLRKGFPLSERLLDIQKAPQSELRQSNRHHRPFRCSRLDLYLYRFRLDCFIFTGRWVEEVKTRLTDFGIVAIGWYKSAFEFNLRQHPAIVIMAFIA